MKKYKVLRDFCGSQTGSGDAQEFIAGDVVGIQSHLANVALKDGSIELFLEEFPPVEVVESLVEIPANLRQKKVIKPKEKK